MKGAQEQRNMTNTSENLTAGEIKAGEMCVECIGAEVRFWIVQENGHTLKLAGRSYSWMRQRVLQLEGERTSTVPAADLTSARCYNRRDRAAGAALVRRYFPGTGTVHFFYAGHGPSGAMAGFSSQGHYTIPG
jgi:hypothetical protein